MTNPSDTRDSELVARLRKEGNRGQPPMGNGCWADLADEAADTIERLTSSEEAVPVAWRSEMRLDVFEVDPSEPDGRRWKWKVILSQVPPIEGKGVIFRNITPLYASPREGHVEVPVVTDEQVERASKAWDAYPSKWPTLERMRAALEAALQSKKPE